MTKKRTCTMQLEPLQLTFTVTEGADILVDNNSLDTEIECPSCQSNMDLHSVSVSPYYSCEDCEFCLCI